LLAHGRWFSPGTPASSIPKAGRHDILLKVALTPKIKKSIYEIGAKKSPSPTLPVLVSLLRENFRK
jgi:hypothetical protein